jgi:ABC-type uncharacterized transport system fused permease/ATPase subunit
MQTTCSGSAVRVTKLLETLEAQENVDTEDQQHKFKEGPFIRFSGVTIVTPAAAAKKASRAQAQLEGAADVTEDERTTLVRDLSFTVEQGDSLMITGHNGAGKSSIFRCLGGSVSCFTPRCCRSLEHRLTWLTWRHSVDVASLG